MQHKPKRTRSTGRRDRAFRDTHARIVCAWRDSNAKHTPAQDTFAKCSAIVNEADVTNYDRGRLAAANWALREYSVLTHARWQLYLDDVPVTSDEISAKRAAGDEDAWLRVKGRHEYDESHDPYYSPDEPQWLHSSREHCDATGRVHNTQ